MRSILNTEGADGGALSRNFVLVILGYLYRFASNFAFLALVYLTLNFLSKYSERSIIAFLVLVYSSMRIVSTIRQFIFFQKIERLENEARTGSAEGSVRRQSAREVSRLRHEGELKSYIDLLFLTLIVLLCASKILTS
ncbi:conserved hypothetical protein [Afipia carboxidovorans OM5]|nr:conserved hypothetical protein [Afipia carboxidovorans OM5]